MDMNMDIEETLERDRTSTLRQDPTMIDSTVLDPTAVTTKTRRAQVKLTGERLMDSERGLPYLMKIGKKRLHISSKKSNFENLSSIIRIYQLWAHQLYPKAKFNDFIILCQQLGKSDKMLREFRKNVIRKELGISSVGKNENTVSTTPVTTTHNTDNSIRHSDSNSTNNISQNFEQNKILTKETNLTIGNTDNGNNNNNNNINEGNVSVFQVKSVFVPEEEEEEEDDDLYSLSALSNKRTLNIEPSMSSHRDVERNVNLTTEEEIQKLEQEQLNETNVLNNILNNDNRYNNEFEEDEEALEAMREFDI
ncbi:hypothetical protein RI543_000418 [Arxiozyma heterogenica]|uniref:Chromosome segregation in meiosis protein n=1 Tax=Arxiozyma heterogenica TaxID=278026 RepID=A0AAN8A9J0_9SACH|nr:hypothetical protein RI543_000418 [Kazachstania heterogenica]